MTGRAAFARERIGGRRQRRREFAGGEGTAGEPGHGEAEPEPPFETAVPQEVRIDGAVRDGQAQPGNQMVFELFPDLYGVGFFVFHGSIQRGS